jgi:hypothetical protein
MHPDTSACMRELLTSVDFRARALNGTSSTR